MLSTHHLHKRYGTAVAVQDLNLTVRPGEIYGFLGPNGAGKTTTILMLLGIERPTSGRIELFGQRDGPDSPRLRQRIGVVGESQYLYDDMTAWEYLLFFGQLYGVARPAVRAQALLERLNLWEFRRLLARDHSRGMQQKLGLARALLHEPELLILDEPVSGLDPHGIRQVRELLQEENRRGVTIFVSSHILSEVERTAHRVGILHGGRLVAEDSVDAITARLQPEGTVTLDIEGATLAMVTLLGQQPFVAALERLDEAADPSRARLRLRLNGRGDYRREIAAIVTDQGGLITAMRQERLSLEEAFVRLTSDSIGALTGDEPRRRRRTRSASGLDETPMPASDAALSDDEPGPSNGHTTIPEAAAGAANSADRPPADQPDGPPNGALPPARDAAGRGGRRGRRERR